MLSNQGNYSHPRHSGLFRTKDEDRICKGAPDTCIALLCDTELEVPKKVIRNTEGEIRPPTLMRQDTQISHVWIPVPHWASACILRSPVLGRQQEAEASEPGEHYAVLRNGGTAEDSDLATDLWA